MSDLKSYPNIDAVQTGKKLKRLTEKAGYSPKEIQKYLELVCIQPIYRWYKGQTIPNLDHLLQLCDLLQVKVEDIIVRKNRQLSLPAWEVMRTMPDNASFEIRIIAYMKLLTKK